MEWSIVWSALGFACFIGAGVMITQVKSAKLGEHSSRLIAVVLAVSAYYGATSIVDIVPMLTLNPVKFSFMKYLVPTLGLIGLVCYGWKIYENWQTEMDSVMKSGWKLITIVTLALCARFFLSL